jgi:imidazolonepropionase-like amidohydrolase
MRVVSVFVLTACSSPTSSTTTPPPPTAAIVLRGGSVVDPRAQTITQQDVYICNGVIAGADAACSFDVVDVTGKFLIPGLVDMHVHARGVSLGNEDFVDWPIDMEAAVFARAGVTAFLDSMNNEATIFTERDAQRATTTIDQADIFASGGAFTPTGGHGTEYDLPETSYHLVDTPEQATAAMDAIAAKHPDLVKIMYDHRGDDGGPDVADGQVGALGVAMRKDVMTALVAAATAHGLTVQVHTGVWNDARDAITAGATVIAHLGEPAIPADVVALAASHHVTWTPTMTLYHGLTDIIADQTLLDDPLLAATLPPAIIESYRTANLDIDRFTTAWLQRHTLDAANLRALHDGGVTLLAGTDAVELGAFPGWSLHRELALFVEAGLSPWDALASATINAGAVLGHDYGIAPGAEANIVVLDASPIDDIRNTTKIVEVVHHGGIVTMH